MKILVTGSTGLVGSALVKALAKDGHTVCRLMRLQSKTTSGSKDGFDVAWNPATGELGGAGVGPDAVVNLAGASIAGESWTKERKALLRSSRIDTSQALVKALAKMNARPTVLVSASAIGIYGDRGDRDSRRARALWNYSGAARRCVGEDVPSLQARGGRPARFGQAMDVVGHA